MFATSTFNLLKLCRSITTLDCQSIFNQHWHYQKPTFNAVVIINEIQNSVPQQSAHWSKLLSQENDSDSLKNELLLFVAHKRGEVLHAFLSALEKETDDSHLDLQKDIELTVSGYACQSSALDVALLRKTSGKLSKKQLTEEEQQLILCTYCGDVMDDPVLLACLHLCCRTCAVAFSCRCGRNLKELALETNLYVLNRIAEAVERTCSQNDCRSVGSGPQGDMQSQSDRASRVPVCSVHDHELKFWCSECEKFCCDTYVSMKCGKSKHTYYVIYEVAKKLKPWMDVFSSRKQKPETTGNITLRLPTQCDPKIFTEKYMNVLEEKERRITSATRSAIDDARASITKHYEDFRKEADGILEQLTQAGLYIQSFRHDHYFYIFQQRKMLSQQLRLLLFRTGNSDLCHSLPGNADLCISCTDQPDQMCLNVKRLLIECLPDNYNYFSLSKELVGMIKVTETDSPTHLFWDNDYNMTKEKEQLTLVANLELQVERWKKKFLEADQTVQTLTKRMNDMEKPIQTLEVNRSIDINSPISDSDLVKNLQKTSLAVIKSMTSGDVDEVLAVLLSQDCINVRDEENLKIIDGPVKRAEALIDVVMKKNDECRKCFLKSLEENAGRKDLADIIRSGEVSNGSR